MLIKSLSTSCDDRYIHLHQYKLMDKTIGSPLSEQSPSTLAVTLFDL